MTVAELLDSTHLMGFLVVQDGNVLMEHYAADHGAKVPWATKTRHDRGIAPQLLAKAIQKNKTKPAEKRWRHNSRVQTLRLARETIADKLA